MTPRWLMGILFLGVMTLTACAVPTNPSVQSVPREGQFSVVVKKSVIRYPCCENRLTEIQKNQLIYFLKAQPVAEIHLSDCYAESNQDRKNGRMGLLRSYLLSRGYKRIIVMPPAAPASKERPCIHVTIISPDFYHTDCKNLPYDAPTADPFYCATQRNLYNMLADPSDLHAKKPSATFDGAPLTHAIDQYHNGKANQHRDK